MSVDNSAYKQMPDQANMPLPPFGNFGSIFENLNL
jgi:hypothetical protein